MREANPTIRGRIMNPCDDLLEAEHSVASKNADTSTQVTKGRTGPANLSNWG